MQEVHEIYRAQYANVIRYDHLPAGLDYAVFDVAVNSGTKRASRFLQAIVGQRTDGVIGMQTLQAVEDYVARHGVEQLIIRLCDNRLRFICPEMMRRCMDEARKNGRTAEPYERKA